MDTLNKTAAAGVIFFMVILAGFVGIKVDQTTIAMLGGAFIGVVIAIPTTALIMVVGLRGERQPEAPPTSNCPPPFQQQQQLPPQVTHNYYDQRHAVVVVNVPANTPASEQRFIVARELRVTPIEAKQMIDAGEVRCLPAGR